MSSYQSNLIVYLVLVAAFVVLHLAQAQCDVKMEYASKHVYCGRDLTNALQFLCDSVYNMIFISKRSDPEMEMDDHPYAYDDPLRSRSSAKAMMGRFGDAKLRRRTRGVVDECCMQPCSIEDLRSYCKY